MLHMLVYMFMEYMKTMGHRLQHKLPHIELNFPEWTQESRLKILRIKTERFEFESENQSER